MANYEDNYKMIGEREFLNLTAAEVRRLVRERKKPATGIFLADGSRRLVMTQTGLEPTSSPDRFYKEYLEIVTGYFRENLVVFFDHGLNTLFFPLFGGSLLGRDKTYKHSIIPGLTRLLFQDNRWLDFYREYDIRVKAYGDPGKLTGEFPGLNLPDVIERAVAFTSHHRSHTLYYGFFSTPWPGAAMIGKLADFVKTNGRAPNQRQSLELYYGENVAPADFFINSTRIGGLGALPPLVADQDTRIYTTAAPSIMALDRQTFREILHDLLFRREQGESRFQGRMDARDIQALKDFYQQHRRTVVGPGKRIGGFWVMNLEK
jgi:hypothetical protein